MHEILITFCTSHLPAIQVNDAGIPCAIVSQMKVAEFLMDHQNDQNLKEALLQVLNVLVSRDSTYVDVLLLQPVSGWALKNVKV